VSQSFQAFKPKYTHNAKFNVEPHRLCVRGGSGRLPQQGEMACCRPLTLAWLALHRNGRGNNYRASNAPNSVAHPRCVYVYTAKMCAFCECTQPSDVIKETHLRRLFNRTIFGRTYLTNGSRHPACHPCGQAGGRPPLRGRWPPWSPAPRTRERRNG
jgi:hypothetical protein